MTDRPRQFASDNQAGACPEVMDALARANQDHAPGYGADPLTERATGMLREVFETDCGVFFVHTGTAANALALAGLCHPYNAVICEASAHIETDECGAPGFFTPGMKLIPVRGDAGKLSPAVVEDAIARRSDVHANKPAVLSVTQATELGTVYDIDEIAALADAARRHHQFLHMDGARFANAAASLGLSPRRLSWEAGVDVLCLGGTKNGALGCEAILFFNRILARDFAYRLKQAGQLASKMRFLAAQWAGLLQDGVWLRNAGHANHMAGLLERELASCTPAILARYPRQANAVFVSLPEAVCRGLRERGWEFYTDVSPDGAARFMCAWDTTETDVDALVIDITRLPHTVLTT